MTRDDPADAAYSQFAIQAKHRHEYVVIPTSHTKYFVPRPAPLKIMINLKPFALAANIAGYTSDGSFRYEEGEAYRIAQTRLVWYHSDDHATHQLRYNGSLVVLPKFITAKDQDSLWITLSRLLGHCTGLHAFHRVAFCSSPQTIQAQM